MSATVAGLNDLYKLRDLIFAAELKCPGLLQVKVKGLIDYHSSQSRDSISLVKVRFFDLFT